MIHVIASIHLFPGKEQAVKEIYADFVPRVEKEAGCLMYRPCLDLPTDIPTQQKRPDTVTVVEQWESLAHFKAHLDAPHVIRFREAVKGVVERVSIQVLEGI